MGKPGMFCKKNCPQMSFPGCRDKQFTSPFFQPRRMGSENLIEVRKRSRNSVNLFETLLLNLNESNLLDDWRKGLVDCPTQLTLVNWICQLSRRWEPFKRGSKIFGAFLQPGKDIWGQFFCKMYFVCL